MLLPRILALQLKTAVYPKMCYALSSHASGSKALDVILGGGYPSGCIIEVQGTNIKTCWQIAWLAAAAAYKRGRRVTACSAISCLDFGAPDAVLDVVRCMDHNCSLVLVDAWGRIAEAAAPATPDLTFTRSLRNRRLASFLRQLSFWLLAPRAWEGECDSGIMNGISVHSADTHMKTQLGPAPSVLICNAEQGGHAAVLQQYAAMRLRVSEGVSNEFAEGYIIVELLKGPNVNSRMPVARVRLPLSSNSTHVLSWTTSNGAFPTVMDLMEAAVQLGIVQRVFSRESIGEPAVADSSADHNTAPGEDVSNGYRYLSVMADTLPQLMFGLTKAGLITQLKQEIDKLQV